MDWSCEWSREIEDKGRRMTVDDGYFSMTFRDDAEDI